MGIRIEKDTILNWINEMGKHLRLYVDKWESGLEENKEIELDHSGYKEFFQVNREYFLQADESKLLSFVDGLQKEQVRPLGLLLMYDGLLSRESSLLHKAKFLLELNMNRSGDFSFEDYGYLATINKHI